MKTGGNDQRIAFFRGALEALVESLDATVRIQRWTDAEAIPEPLQQSAALLVNRLGAANRLAAGKFVGPQIVAARVTAMNAAIQRLDGAYVQYRHRVDVSPAHRSEAAAALDAEIGEVKAEAHQWA